jgi:hypothetical protein
VCNICKWVLNRADHISPKVVCISEMCHVAFQTRCTLDRMFELIYLRQVNPHLQMLTCMEICIYFINSALCCRKVSQLLHIWLECLGLDLGHVTRSGQLHSIRPSICGLLFFCDSGKRKDNTRTQVCVCVCVCAQTDSINEHAGQTD